MSCNIVINQQPFLPTPAPLKQNQKTKNVLRQPTGVKKLYEKIKGEVFKE